MGIYPVGRATGAQGSGDRSLRGQGQTRQTPVGYRVITRGLRRTNEASATEGAVQPDAEDRTPEIPLPAGYVDAVPTF